ncbi:SDR family oxidoreductase [Akkermansiaceae bacterium]|nr:SDR family oxidoreductase [Akkermansiaceae bacterium]MDB4389086.1 SDR family oxidoreductase [Akkermansiaceae bacterium]MDB4695322.1 SDR family oxidoreductase [Akkermansiaceae bacterium]
MNRKIQNSRVLVTGGAGFIGSNLIEVLLQQDNEVVCLDNFMTGHRKNLEAFKLKSNFELIEGDIRDLETCHKACDGIDYVLHQAAIGSVPRSIEDPILSAEINELGFLKMLVAARDAKVKRFVYAASSSTYGDSEKLPKVEDEIGKPLSPYAITKYVNELYAENFNLLYGMETIGLRYFNVFGRRQDPNGAYAAVIPKFVQQFMGHESPVINGDGTFSRDFCYVDNVVQVNQLAAIVEKPEANGEVYNVAFGGRTDLNEMTSELRRELSRFDPAIGSVDIIHGPERIGDIPHSQADISKARNLLGYRPSHSFADGIREAAEWYYRNLQL